MNSRLAVSILFTLFVVTAFRTEANDAFKKLKTLRHSWVDKVDSLVLVRHRAAENQPCRVGSLSPDGKTITSSFPHDTNVPSSQERHMQRSILNVIDYGRHTAAFERVTTAVSQIQEVLDLMRTK